MPKAMYLTDIEKKAYLRLVALYPKILIIGWLTSLPFLLFIRNIYPFIFFAIFLIFYNSFVMVKFQFILMKYGMAGALAEMFLGWHLNKDVGAPKSKFNKILGITFLTLGILALIVTIGVMSNILS